MKTYIVIATFLMSFLLAASEPLQIGVVDTTRLFHNSAEIRSIHNRIENEMQQKRLELEPLQNKIEAMQMEIEEKRFVWSPEEISKKEQELQKLFREYVDMRDEVVEYMSYQEEALMTPILGKLKSIIEKVADMKGLHIIIEKEALVFAAPHLDITDELIKQLDAKEEEEKQPENEK